MTDDEIFAKAVKRAARTTENSVTEREIIIVLEKEIDRYRDKIKHMENRINELILQCDELTPKEPAQTFTTEQAADGGVMTLTRKTTTWKLVTECLLTNGYFVCCHFDDENNGETITIEYWRA